MSTRPTHRLRRVAAHLDPSPSSAPAAARSGIGAFDLSGRVAFITGGARHFGLEIANALASAGADLVITSRTLDSAEAAAAELAAEHGVTVKGLALDVGEFSSVESAAADAIAAMGHIDILVNNAGGGSGPGANVGGIFDRSNVRPALRTAGGCPDAPLGRSVRLSHGRRRWRR